MTLTALRAWLMPRLLAAATMACLLGVDAGAAAPPAASSRAADAAARDAALAALAGRLQLPLLDEAVAIFSRQLRRTLPTTLVVAIGDNAGLGSRWRPGDPTYDDALRRIDSALAVEEARGGPLVRLERGDLLTAVDVPWSMADIAFVDATLATDLGLEAQRALDAQAAQQAIATLKRRVASGAGGAGIAAAFADLDVRAAAQFGDASLMLLAMNATDHDRVQRLQRLMNAVSLAPSDALGQRIVDRLSQRLIDAAMAQLPGLLDSIGTQRFTP